MRPNYETPVYHPISVGTGFWGLDSDEWDAIAAGKFVPVRYESATDDELIDD